VLSGVESISRLVLAHRGRTVAIALLVLLAGAAAVALLLPRVSERNEYPTLAGYQANEAIRTAVGTGGYERPFVAVTSFPPGTTVDSPAAVAALGDAAAAAATATGSRVASVANTGDRGLVSPDGRTALMLLFPPPVEEGGLPGSALGEGAGLEPIAADAMRRHLPPGVRLHVTGLDALAIGTDGGGLNVPVKLAVTVVAALAVLVWMFRSPLAAVPLLMAGVAVPASFLGLLVVSPLVTIHETTLIMLPLLGVGIAVDYALILVTRWREERAAGGSSDDAVHRAMATAGHAVAYSAAAVAVGLAMMVVLPIPLLRSLGVGGMVVTATSAAVALTLLPIVLAAAGRRLDRHGVTHRDAGAARAWSAWARIVVRHKWPAALLSGGLLAALAAVATGINLNVPVTADLAPAGPGREGLVALQQGGLPTGALTAFDVFVPAGTDPAAIAAGLSAVPGVHTALAPTGAEWRAAAGAVVTVVPTDEGGTDAGRATIARVIDMVPEGVLVGGNVTQQVDYLSSTYGTFGGMLALVALVTFVALTRAFGSPLIAVKAILVNLFSLGAVLGAMVVLWQWGWGTEQLLGIRPDGAIGTFVPVTIFAFLYGLTMDYEVLILPRVREAYRRTGTTDLAIVDGIGRSGRVVSGAALILFLAFAAMAGGGELDVAIFASGVALGILLDATLVRGILVPATLALLGRANWWHPTWVDARAVEPPTARPSSHAR
jgi:RND superfamily putative drug exporter